MAGSTQATIAVAAPSYAKRKARALIAWLPESEGALWIAGRDLQAAANPEHLERCRRARQLAASRPAGLDQTGVASPLPSGLEEHVGALQAHPWGAQVVSEAGEPMLVDLRWIRAAQPFVHVEDAAKRVEGLTADDLTAIARVTLPIPPPEPRAVPLGFDESKNAWVLSSASPNLRVLGHFAGAVPKGSLTLQGVGFVVAEMDSYLSVGAVDGRYFLRDGYHRAYGLLKAGITHVPALVRDYGSFPEARMAAHGLLPIEVILGDRPPTLADYLNDNLVADTFAPLTTKIIVIQALEVTPLG